MMNTSTMNIDVCAKCATNKAGKRSCCARGGAWFKNCGDVGGTKSDHTWVEGMRSCERVDVEATLKPRFQGMRSRAGVDDYPLVTIESQNTSQRQTLISHTNTVSRDGLIEASRDCVDLERDAFCASVVPIVLYLQIYM